MRNQIIEEDAESSIVWDNLEGWARGLIQGALQDVLEEEVTELLGSLKSERRKPWMKSADIATVTASPGS